MVKKHLKRIKEWEIRKRQILVLFIFSIIGSTLGIIHGVFFDLKLEEMMRFSLEGLLVTTLVVFPSLLLLEWIFDWNNEEK